MWIHKPPVPPMLPDLPFEVDPVAVAMAREALAKRKYQQMMDDAQFAPGAVVDDEA